MKANFKQQFLNLRKIIQTNVGTLKDLIKQSEHLSDIIQCIGVSEAESLIKKQLEDTKKEIAKSIEVLSEQTQRLFETYNNLIEEVFGK